VAVEDSWGQGRPLEAPSTVASPSADAVSDFTAYTAVTHNTIQ